jgi:CDGSH-type Zn-finger protein
MPARVTMYPNGPLLIRGDFEITDLDGNVVDARRETVALCRCGASRTKPFCDGTHKLIGFRAPGEPSPRTLRPPVQTTNGSG